MSYTGEESMASKSFDKLIEEISNMSVLDLSELVKQLEDKFGVSAAMPVAAAPAAAQDAPAAEEKTAFKVTLEDAGSEKIKVIKALKGATGLSLSESKAAVEGAPTVIADSASKEDAEKMKKTLEEAGAKVKLA